MGAGAVGGAAQGYVIDLGRMALEKLMKLVDDWRGERSKPATTPRTEAHA
jgi:hypothetical protein